VAALNQELRATSTARQKLEQRGRRAQRQAEPDEPRREPPVRERRQSRRPNIEAEPI
jgi:hypothetical protein